ncbi:hypothetical protein PDESU_03229 [Pontiella desulfatans]|uniref:Lipoprotein n=1 Tax=Pontiella desulfatans TaxID=2750659 RepID=A0A6C2U588_PONDE|nr:hypothetical protein [Pontiella desulfatans]VGO14664.1 hypothetical protein PDESU_03229 [Pontiella desulfatans]
MKLWLKTTGLLTIGICLILNLNGCLNSGDDDSSSGSYYPPEDSGGSDGGSSGGSSGGSTGGGGSETLIYRTVKIYMTDGDTGQPLDNGTCILQAMDDNYMHAGSTDLSGEYQKTFSCNGTANAYRVVAKKTHYITRHSDYIHFAQGEGGTKQIQVRMQPE